MADTSFFFNWLHETAARCYLGVDLGNGLNHNSLSRFADGTPYSSSDLLYFTLILLFTWTKFFKSNSLPSFSFLGKNFRSPIPLFSSIGQKFSKSNSSSLFYWTKICLSPTSILQKYSKAIPNSVLAGNLFPLRKKILSPIFFLT